MLTVLLSAATNLLLLTAACGPLRLTAAQASGDPAQRALILILNQLDSRNVEEAEVICIPADVLTRSNVTADGLRRGYHYKLTIPRFSSSGQAAPFIAALRDTTANSTARRADLRWGAHFKFANGTVHRLYMNGAGDFGEIDEMPVAFHGKLTNWFRSFSTAMK